MIFDLFWRFVPISLLAFGGGAALGWLIGGLTGAVLP